MPQIMTPHEQFRRMRSGFTKGTVPNEVVKLAYERDVSPLAAWREHFSLTQAEVAARVGITQAAYAQMERVKRPRKATLEKRGGSDRVGSRAASLVMLFRSLRRGHRRARQSVSPMEHR